MPGAMDQVIDQQLESISTGEIAGAYRALCGCILVQTVVAVRKRAISRNEDAEAKRTAVRWIGGQPGVITFRECCEVLNLDIDRAREALQSLAHPRPSQPISRVAAGV